MQARSLSALLPAALLAAASAVAMPVLAQMPSPVPLFVEAKNIVNLDAEGTIEVPQDWLSIELTSGVSADTAANAQNQLNVAVKEALDVLNPDAKPDSMQVQTGSLSVSRRTDDKGQTLGYGGGASVWINGNDFPRILAAVGKVKTMTINRISYGLTKEASDTALEKARQLAIENFSKQAQSLTKAFGFSRYTLREVNVGQILYVVPMSGRLSDAMELEHSTPVQIQPGVSPVSVTVRGSVQLSQ